MAISGRIEQALIHYDNKNYDSCLLELSVAIDATAKRKWPHTDKKSRQVANRFQDFCHEYRQFVFFGVFKWMMVPMDDLAISEYQNTLAKILYMRMRNPAIHDAGVDEDLEIIDSGIKIGGTFGIGHDFILALIICVIGDPANKDEKFKNPVRSRFIYSVELPLSNAWGHFEALSSWLYGQAKIIHHAPPPSRPNVVRRIGER